MKTLTRWLLLILAVALASCMSTPRIQPTVSIAEIATATAPSTLTPSPSTAAPLYPITPTPRTEEAGDLPVLMLVSGQTVIPGMQGTYCWPYQGCADVFLSPEDCAASGNILRDREIHFRFEKKPATSPNSLSIRLAQAGPLGDFRSPLEAGDAQQEQDEFIWRLGAPAGDYCLAATGWWWYGDVEYYYPITIP